MKFPYSENSTDIKNMDTNFYWLKKDQSISYNVPNQVLEKPYAKELVINSNLLSSWISKQEREKLYADKNYRALTFLFMFHHTLQAIEEIRIRKTRG